MGLRVQLKHLSLYCENPIPCHSAMLVIHINRIHNVAIQYCGCSKTKPQHLQLLRQGLYLASQILVKTCASFQVLDLLHKLATKSSTYDFYCTLEKLTNNAGIDVPKLRYRALFWMSIQWRHLKLLKWGGRGHDPSDVVGTKPGELVVVCPSCPHPGINLPDGWEDAPIEMQYVIFKLPSHFPFSCPIGFFTWCSLPWMPIFVSRTSLFKTIRRILGSVLVGPTCFPGKIMRDISYRGWMMRMWVVFPCYPFILAWQVTQISTCVGLQALAQADTKFSRGLRYTGVGGTFCGRSEMILRMGNLQKDEKYVNSWFL